MAQAWEVWDADAELAPAAAAALIDGQFPALAPVRLEPLGEGWDNWAYAVNGRLVFRFPRRAIAAPWMEAESRLLPRIAAHVPLRIPVPTFLGRPARGYPYPFAGYEHLPGVTADRARLPADLRARSAGPLGTFLAALHALDIAPRRGETFPVDEIRRADLPWRAKQIEERLERVSGDLDAERVREVSRELVSTAPWSGPPRWVHGDLYSRHLLVGDDGLVSGLIDWGDMHRGDPALDLSIAFSWLPPQARKTFRAAYGDIDPDTWDRARFRALNYGVLLLDYGLRIEDAALVETARLALEQVLG